MNKTLKSQINRIFDLYQSHWNQPPNKPATEESISFVAEWYSGRYQKNFPEQLVDFWKVTNGIDFDGKALWATERRDRMSGVIDVNELHTDISPDLFFFGQCDDLDMYAYAPSLDRWQVREIGSLDNVLDEQDSFDKLANTVLRAMIDSEDR